MKALLPAAFQAAFVASCSLLGDPSKLRTAADVRDDICTLAELMPSSPEVDELRRVCDVSESLADVAAAFEKCSK